MQKEVNILVSLLMNAIIHLQYCKMLQKYRSPSHRRSAESILYRHRFMCYALSNWQPNGNKLKRYLEMRTWAWTCTWRARTPDKLIMMCVACHSKLDAASMAILAYKVSPTQATSWVVQYIKRHVRIPYAEQQFGRSRSPSSITKRYRLIPKVIDMDVLMQDTLYKCYGQIRFITNHTYEIWQASFSPCSKCTRYRIEC